MIINDIKVHAGTQEKIEVNIARLPSHSPINLSITVARSKKPGPVLLLSGGLHGDEINGVEIVRRIIEDNLHVPLKGTIICIPVINVYGFIHFSRYVPDGKDVNRSFPGNKNGSLASRVAYYLTRDIIPQIDYGIDFHTGGADRTNYPQIRCMMDDPRNAELAGVFNAPFTLHAKFRTGSLRQTAAKKNKRIIVYEGGESSRFDEFAIQQGVHGAIRIMNHLGMCDEQVTIPDHDSRLIKNSSWIRARASGLFQTMIVSGERVNRNQLVGYITDPFGDFMVPVKATATGYVIGLNNNPIVHQGDAVMHIGVQANQA